MAASISPIGFSAEDNQRLADVGFTLLLDGVGFISETAFWALYLALYCFAVRIQFRRGVGLDASLVIFSVTCFLFASSSILWALNFSVSFMRIRDIFMDHTDMSLAERISWSHSRIVALGVPTQTLFLVNMLIGDAVVIWRAWVLWRAQPRLQRVVLLPMFILLASLAFTIVAMRCLAMDGFDTESSIPSGSRTCRWAEPIAWALSLLTNAISTTLIALKAFEHHQFLKRMNDARRWTQNERILILLVESGLIYCLFWLSQVIIFISISSFSQVRYLYVVVSSMGHQISGIYPTAIIVLVNMQRSIQHSYCGFGTTTVSSGATYNWAYRDSVRIRIDRGSHDGKSSIATEQTLYPPLSPTPAVKQV